MLTFYWVCALLCAAISGCGGDNTASFDSGSLTSIAYVKRPIESIGNPTEATRFSPGGDLYIKLSASTEALAYNISALITGGTGDVSGPEVSFDGTKVIFSAKKSVTSKWDLWQYDVETYALTPILLNVSHDDIDPAFLPDGRIVFSSNRQQRNQAIQNIEGSPQAFKQLDEYQREPVFNLHVFNPANGTIAQISFNQSHDRNPSVMSNGKILFSRWDHLGDRNQYSVYTINPDGTDLAIHYGAHSPGSAFLHPREAENGHLISSVMPLTQSYQGGAIIDVDITNHDEAFILNSTSETNSEKNNSGQQLITSDINFQEANSLSPRGRYTTPYPLWNGSGNILASYSVSRPLDVIDAITGVATQVEDEPFYNLVLLDPTSGSQEIIETSEPGFALLEGIAILPRSLPTIIEDTVTLQDFFDATPATISIRSVYDTDFLERMGPQVFIESESVATLTNPNTAEQRTEIADIASLKDPLITPPDQLPAKFVRVTKAVLTPPGLAQAVIGKTPHKMRQIIGYSPVEPDGSVKFSLANENSHCVEFNPGASPLYATDSAIEISVVDSKARAMQLHSSWLQVRPGENLRCNGCHSPRHGQSINSNSVTEHHPNVIDALQVISGDETMAETRDRVRRQDPQLAVQLQLGESSLSRNIEYQDIWTDLRVANVEMGTPFANAYIELINNDSDSLHTEAAINKLACGIINYSEHIQPIWEKTRGLLGRDTCANCHDESSPAGGLAIPSTLGNSGRYKSYDNLLTGTVELNAEGKTELVIDSQGLSHIKRSNPAIRTGNNVASGLARGSHLMEVLTNTELKAPQTLTAVGQRTDHGKMMSSIELRLISEWIDIGAQYFNQPYDDMGTIRGRVSFPDESEFVSQVLPILERRCSSCHAPQKGTLGVYDGAQFEDVKDKLQPRFILTGQAEKDYLATINMIDTSSAPQSALLLRRATESDHPGLPNDNGVLQPALTELDSDYAILYQWILSREEDL